MMTVTAFGFSSMHAIIRHLAGELHPFEIAFFRNFFGLLVLTPFFVRHGLGLLRTDNLRWHVARGMLQVCAMLMFFTALSLAPLAQVSALSFTAPLFATLGAALILREQIRGRRIAALVVGFAGAMIILRPGAVPIDLGSLLVLCSSAIWALALLIIKSLSRTDSSATLTAYMGLILTPLSLVPALFFWRWPSTAALAWLIVMGVVGAAAQLSMAQAFKNADVTAVLPIDFTRLVWASVLGYLVFQEIPGKWTWIGAIVIFSSTTYIAYREARVQSTAPIPAAVPSSNPLPGGVDEEELE